MIVAPRPHFEWRLRTRSLLLRERTLVAGIVNVTPDSFSDGGRFLSSDAAVEHALRLLIEGADLLDIGGESTRPGTRPQVSAQQELDRILPVIESVLRESPKCLISADTYKAEVARQSIAAGAEIVNDVSGFLWDPAMASACADMGCGVILMHTRGTMSEWKTLPPLQHDRVVPLVLDGLHERAAQAVESGVERERIVLDPGFGFGKSGEENYPLLAHFDALHALGYPLLAGTSRKSFLGKTLERARGAIVPPNERLAATLASVTAAALAGAHIVRVHDVREAREVCALVDAIRESAKD